MDLRGMWVALKHCGCCVGACRESVDADRIEREHNDKELLVWLRAGFIVRFVTWDEWHANYMAGFLECPHDMVTK